MSKIKFGTKVVRVGDSNREEMLVTNVSANGALIGCIWRPIGAWYSAGRFLVDQLEVVGEYSSDTAHEMRISYERG